MLGRGLHHLPLNESSIQALDPYTQVRFKPHLGPEGPAESGGLGLLRLFKTIDIN